MDSQQFKASNFPSFSHFNHPLTMPLFFDNFDSYEEEEDEENDLDIVPLDEELNQVVLTQEEEEEEEEQELPNGFSNVTDSEMDDYSPEDN